MLNMAGIIVGAAKYVQHTRIHSHATQGTQILIHLIWVRSRKFIQVGEAQVKQILWNAFPNTGNDLKYFRIIQSSIVTQPMRYNLPTKKPALARKPGRVFVLYLLS